MRPTPLYLVAAVAASLTAMAAGAQAVHAYGGPSTTSGTTATGTMTTGTTAGTGTVGTTTGTTASTAATSGTTTSSVGTTTGASSSSTYVPAPQSNTSAANGAIQSSTTAFSNGAQYVVNADGTVTVLGNVPTTTTTNGGVTGNTLAATVDGTGTAGTRTTLNALASDVNGTAPGQTSSGTAAGNSSAGIVDANAALASGTTLNGTTLNGTTLNGYAPGVTAGGITAGSMAGIDYGAMADAGSGVNANGERVASLGGAGAPVGTANTARTPTPTFDMAARAGMAKELNRRARGQSPRIYGIAPRTDADRTDQMPDDPVIRY